MTSTAVSAQGSTFFVGTGSGSPVTITGVTVGWPTLITATGHGFSNGDVVSFAGLTGANAGVLNGNSFVVKYATTNTFCIDANTTGDTITYSGSPTVTGQTWTQVNNMREYSGADGVASELERTNLSSVAKEFMLGLVDPGQFSFTIDTDMNDAGQAALRSFQQVSAPASMKLVLPGSGLNRTYSFTGYCKKFPVAGGVDKIITGAVDIRITGPVTLT